jgi:hypothetical protein
MSRRMRLTVIYEFDYLVHKLGSEQGDRLIENFLKDPTGFLHPTELEVNEELVVAIEDITEEE